MCQLGTSVSSVAMSHGINANVIHKWRRRTVALAQRCSAGAPHLRSGSGHPHQAAARRDAHRGNVARGCGGGVRRVVRELLK
jgi:transposase-like protein